MWVFLSGLGLSFLPKITWLGRPNFESNAYINLSFGERLLEIFHKWDAKIYTDLAFTGYPTAAESWKFAFFPGWPKLLSMVNELAGFSDPRSLLYVAVILNLFFCALAVWSWTRALLPLADSARLNGFVLLLLLYPTSIFYFTSYPEIAVVALSGLSALAVQDRAFRWHILWTLPLLVSFKHAGIALGLAFPLWTLLKSRRFDFKVWMAWSLGVTIVLWFYIEKSNNPMVWMEAQKGWGRSWGGPWRIWMDLHRKGVELVLYVVWLFAAPIYFFSKGGGFRGLLRGQNEAGLMFLIVSSIFVPLWFGSSTASIYRVILLGTPALLLPVDYLVGRSVWLRRVSIGLLLLLNIHATYRYVAGLYLA